MKLSSFFLFISFTRLTIVNFLACLLLLLTSSLPPFRPPPDNKTDDNSSPNYWLGTAVNRYRGRCVRRELEGPSEIGGSVYKSREGEAIVGFRDGFV